MHKIWESIKEGIKLLPRGLWDFFKKAYVFCFFYGQALIFPILLAFALMLLLKGIDVSEGIYTTVFKLVLIIGQIIPASVYAGAIKSDPNIEGSMDICFSGWIIISILIWFCF